MRALRGVYFVTILVLWTIVCYGMISAAWLFVKVTGNHRDGRPFHEVATIWANTLFALMPWWRVEMRGHQNLPGPDEPLVIVGNHESMADIWALYSLRRQFRWLSKDSVFRYPIVGVSMRLAGYVSVVRGDRSSHTRALEESAAWLRRGVSMFFFPEGTRSIDGKIKPFKLGAFRLAADCEVRVLPIALHGAGKMLPKGSLIPGSAVVRIEVLPAVSIKRGEEEEKAESIRAAIVAAHERLAVD